MLTEREINKEIEEIEEMKLIISDHLEAAMEKAIREVFARDEADGVIRAKLILGTIVGLAFFTSLELISISKTLEVDSEKPAEDFIDYFHYFFNETNNNLSAND